ncbi:endoplasmic reticulum metallopeptidase 1 isoform X2 [Macadamia integrifolia]|uniref:endoplasmic reticulum metallopeptidase 1 isoform X2 n=1 Tax=Macadamia integrifolia TaxID=60698 RepID=UPI001C4EA947|nr:endoplasmic reticulum metallopeptidase 1 isoform X2 [Macadamia integrifolia]
MVFRLSSGDFSAFKLLGYIGILYGLMSIFAYSIIHMKHIKPLDFDAPSDRFSEARAVEHIRKLSKEIDGRQEGRPGLMEAAGYIKTQLETIAERAGPSMRIEIEESLVAGSFNMLFLGHGISLAYRNHTNIIMRVSSTDSQDTDPSVLVNGHFDSTVGSPGAGDCASCVASMIEIARLMVDSGSVPPRPIIFLFNGAEELFLLGAHGFVTTHKWSDTVGAFINVEASGTGGPDLVCQSGPGSWPSFVYAQSAIYPMAHSTAQDIFHVIPGDTDYRILAEDYGEIPGLDIIFLLGGYFYHTSQDTVERLLPGSIQARGENLFSLINAFSSSSKLQKTYERVPQMEPNQIEDQRAVFFDYLTWFLIFYSRRASLVLHSLPIIIFFLVPFFLRLPTIGLHSWCMAFCDFMKGMLFHTIGIILAIILPIVFAIMRLLFSSYAMSWFGHPHLAYLMFSPCSFAGLLIPGIVWRRFPLSQKSSVLKIPEEAYLVAGLSGGFLSFFSSVFMLLAWISFCLSAKFFGPQSLKSVAAYVTPLVPYLVYCVCFFGFLVQFLIEKMGMMGSLPHPYGYFVPDVIVAAVVGISTGLCMGPVVPVAGRWLSRSSIIQFLLHLSLLALAISSQFFPYSMAAPKRVVLQHTVRTADASQIVESSFDFSVVDSNALPFLFKYAPEAAKELQIGSELSFENTSHSLQSSWLASFPVSLLFSGSLKFPARSDDILKQYRYFPQLSSYNQPTFSSTGSRKVYLELFLGSLKEVWVAVLNITGPLSNWSFADNLLPVPEMITSGAPSYICRLSGSSSDNWTFWLEANSSEPLRVNVAVLDQHLVEASRKLKGLFPIWVDVIAYSSFLSSYVF